jgi:hypothetical protein
MAFVTGTLATIAVLVVEHLAVWPGLTVILINIDLCGDSYMHQFMIERRI